MAKLRLPKIQVKFKKDFPHSNDVFFGSANFVESSSTKHSENRITVKNHQETATAFQRRFEEIWGKSVPG